MLLTLAAASLKLPTHCLWPQTACRSATCAVRCAMEGSHHAHSPWHGRPCHSAARHRARACTWPQHAPGAAAASAHSPAALKNYCALSKAPDVPRTRPCGAPGTQRASSRTSSLRRVGWGGSKEGTAKPSVVIRTSVVPSAVHVQSGSPSGTAQQPTSEAGASGSLFSHLFRGYLPVGQKPTTSAALCSARYCSMLMKLGRKYGHDCTGSGTAASLWGNVRALLGILSPKRKDLYVRACTAAPPPSLHLPTTHIHTCY